MIVQSTLLCGAVAALIIRPWRVRPRSLTPTAQPSPRVGGRPAAPAGALWGGAVVGAAMLHPLLGVVVLSWPALRRFRHRRRAHASADRATVRALPEVADLILLGVGAGLTPREALVRCRAWLPPPYGSAFTEALRRADAGESFVVALEAATVDLDAAAPLVRAIVAAEQTPGSVVASLVRVGDEARRRRRADAQERARRLPVTMLLPLVLCVLPAFGLLAVVPLLLGSLRDLGLGP